MINKRRLFRYGMLLASYSRGQRFGLAALVAVTGLGAIIGALQPWSMKILVDYGLRHDPAPWWLRSLTAFLHVPASPHAFVVLAGAASLVFFAANTATNCGMNWLWTLLGRSFTTNLSSDLFARLQRRPLLVHYKNAIGDSLSRLGSDAWCLTELAHVMVVSPSSNLLSLVLIGTVSWKLDRQVAILCVLMAPLLVYASHLFGSRMKQRAKQDREAYTQLVSFVQQTLSAIPVVQAFGREEFNRRRFGALAAESTRTSQQLVLVGSWYGLATGLITTSGAAIVLFVGGQRVLAGHLTIGGLLVFLTYMNGLQSVSAGFLGLYASLKPLEARVDRVLDVLDNGDDLPTVRDAPALADHSLGSGRRVQLERVTFGYEPGRPVVEDVDIEAEAGQTIALVGETGAGKSTVAGLIPRFYDPWRGRVLIDGADVRRLQRESVRRQVAMVLQESFILPISIADNIAYGAPAASRREVVEAARAASADQFIERLPAGYDTVVGERGATLSGGEKQRLSIARTFLKNAPILILDEPTASVDAATEASLVQALKRVMGGRTVFIIGHRLSTLRHADEIIVFHAGKIVERGTHDELIRADGLYRRYFVLQFPDDSVEVPA